VADPVPDLVALYDCRMTIEEQSRNTKGCRFGARLEWTHVRTPAYLARLLLLLGAALVLWISVGQATAEATPAIRLPCKHRGPRLQLVRVGQWFLPTMARRVYPGAQFLRAYLPPAQLRSFP
jgi:hypothetical protein